MTDKFEDNVRKTLHDFELTPSEGLFEKIMDKRTKQPKNGLVLWKNSLGLMLLGVGLVSAWIAIQVYQLPAAQNQTQGIVSTTNSDDFETVETVNTAEVPELLSENKTNASTASQQAVKRGRQQNRKGIVGSVSNNDTYNNNSTKMSITEAEAGFQENQVESKMGEMQTVRYISVKTLKEIFSKMRWLGMQPMENFSTKMDEETNFPVKRVPAPRNNKPGRFEDLSLTLMAGGVQTNYAKMPNGFTEKDRFAFGMQAKTTFKLTNHLQFVTGIMYQQRQTNYSYASVERIEKMNIDTVIGYIVNPGTPPTPVVRYDTTVSIQQNNRNGKGVNFYHYVSLPIGIGYTYARPKGEWYVQAGTLLGVLFSNKGYWMNESALEPSMFQGKNKQFVRAVPLGYFGNIGYKHSITSTLQWHVEGSFSMFSFANTPLGTRNAGQFLVYGLGTGFNFKF
jgi:hypothetical protein